MRRKKNPIPITKIVTRQLAYRLRLANRIQDFKERNRALRALAVEMDVSRYQIGYWLSVNDPYMRPKWVPKPPKPAPTGIKAVMGKIRGRIFAFFHPPAESDTLPDREHSPQHVPAVV